MAAVAHAREDSGLQPGELTSSEASSVEKPPTNRDSGQFSIDRRLWFDAEQCEVGCGSTRVKLTPTELRILTYLDEHRGEWITNEHMLTVVLGRPPKRDKALVRVHLWNIRRKLGPLAWCIESQRGLGTMMRP